jgi:hypothetical protein
MIDLTNRQRHPTEPVRPRRPLLLNIIYWVFLLWILLGWMRFARAILDRSLILEFLSARFLWYFIAAGLAWGILGLPVIWGVLRRQRWTMAYIGVVGLIYPAIYWFERLFLWAEGQPNWLFMLLLTVLWLGVLVGAWRSKRVRRYFLSAEE